MKVRKEITELVTAGIITPETAQKINDYYNTRSGTPQNKLLIVFGILGALITGLGIILVLASNWDDLNRSAKTVIAFVPLILGHVLCAYSLFKKDGSTAWRESSASFLMIAIGACISLIGQIYNIPGDMVSFLLTWMLLAVPLIYVMRSSVVSLLYIAGITWFGCETGYWGISVRESYLFWLLLLLVLPHYFLLYRNKRESNFFMFHNWFVPLSVITILGTIAQDRWELMLIAYVSLFGLLYQFGNIPLMRDQKVRNNGYLVLGSLGTVVVLLGLTFGFFWTELRDMAFVTEGIVRTPEFIVSTILTIAALALLIYHKTRPLPFELKPVEGVFILFIIIFMIGLTSPMAVVLTNFLVLSIGVLTIREGARHYHFGILNYGLLIITALVICRFFDTNIPFILKGLLFIGVGLSFFFVNYWMARKRKEEHVTAPPGTPAI